MKFLSLPISVHRRNIKHFPHSQHIFLDVHTNSCDPHISTASLEFLQRQLGHEWCGFSLFKWSMKPNPGCECGAVEHTINHIVKEALAPMTFGKLHHIQKVPEESGCEAVKGHSLLFTFFYLYIYIPITDSMYSPILSINLCGVIFDPSYSFFEYAVILYPQTP